MYLNKRNEQKSNHLQYSMYRVDGLPKPSKLRAGYPTLIQRRGGGGDLSRLKTSPWLPNICLDNRVFSHSLETVSNSSIVGCRFHRGKSLFLNVYSFSKTHFVCKCTTYVIFQFYKSTISSTCQHNKHLSYRYTVSK